MSPTVLRLDSFSSGSTGTHRQAVTIQREEAFQHGYEKGLGEGREFSLDALTKALADLRQEILADHEKESRLRRHILSTLAPVLHAIVDVLGPCSEKERLKAALTDEAARIVKHAPKQVLIVRCPSDLHPDIADCLTSARFPDVRIEHLPAGQDMVELIADQGTITFRPSLVDAELKAIINDINPED
ncbi:hypothetical protein [Paracoccus sp. (in: a-proteobacteria)]|uniref:hypothetical protein n=1 Tax=Paracoccus sp. TaxID=267 RepID=UPI0028AACA73|nr:hypothetical protein [Paracoccus sp. (in: a-proteobacteria)]